MSTVSYTAKIRSKTTHGADQITVEMPASESPVERINQDAAGYGATVEAIWLTDPVAALRQQLRECMGFAEAWQAHLADIGSDRAAATVAESVRASRHVYAMSGQPAAASSTPQDAAAAPELGRAPRRGPKP